MQNPIGNSNDQLSADNVKGRQRSAPKRSKSQESASYRTEGGGHEFERQTIQNLQEAIKKLPNIVATPLETESIRLDESTQTILNGIWQAHGLLPTDVPTQPRDEMFQGCDLQLDFGVILESTNQEASDSAVILDLDPYQLELQSPAVLFTEITIKSSPAKLRKKILQLLKSRLAFDLAPHEFIDQAYHYAEGSFKVKHRFRHYHKYLLLVSDLEVENGLESFNDVYTNLAATKGFKDAFDQLASPFKLSVASSASQKVVQALEWRETTGVRIAHISVHSLQTINYTNLAARIKVLETSFKTYGEQMNTTIQTLCDDLKSDREKQDRALAEELDKRDTKLLSELVKVCAQLISSSPNPEQAEGIRLLKVEGSPGEESALEGPLLPLFSLAPQHKQDSLDFSKKDTTH